MMGKIIATICAVALCVSLIWLVIAIGLYEKDQNETAKARRSVEIIEVHGCEYLTYRNGGIVHKQNCRYCKERKQIGK